MLSGRCGHRGLTAAVGDAVRDLIRSPTVPALHRPSRDRGTFEMTLRLPVDTADAADRWRERHGLSRQETVEYALVAALQVGALRGQLSLLRPADLGLAVDPTPERSSTP
jgi:hypothetical protein